MDIKLPEDKNPGDKFTVTIPVAGEMVEVQIVV